MPSPTQKYKLIDRGYRKTLLLLPGWAADCRIFSPVDLEFNYLMPLDLSPHSFEEDLLAAMEENGLKKISILGWSLGGFLAHQFSARHTDVVDEAVLVGVRKKYELAAIENIKSILRKNKRAYLYKFYKDCFSPDERETYRWFGGSLMKDYLDTMGLDRLIDGLDYLSECRIDPKSPEGVKVRLVHGSADRIAPIGEAPAIELITMEGAGHMPFLSPQFKKVFDDADTLQQ